MIKRILVANRSEIAIRVMRACREMGIASVAVFSDADKDALFAKYADEAYPIGPSSATQSYLNIPKIIDVAKRCGADAIHPGYGFLAENPEFASACESEGIRFIGPSSRVLRLVGDKVAARREMAKAGIPVVPGTHECIADWDHAGKAAREIGYPVIIKPSGGGGGIGMTIVRDDRELLKALDSAQAIARTTFGLGDVYIEKYLSNPRHIEFQILGDPGGNVIHLGERECSIQRRHQKLIEESPSTALTPDLRAEMGDVARNAAECVGYVGAGTVEFLLSEGRFYFLEVNARIQVEHPVTEMVSGIDIVKAQISIASGNPVGIRQENVSINGCAIECRINAEDPLSGFVPSPGKIKHHHPPGGTGIRVDSGVCSSCTIPPFYDPMISKLIAWGRDRDEAIARMQRALYEYVIVGVKTNIPFHQAVMRNARFVEGELSTHFIENETTLQSDMKKIVEGQKQLQEKLAGLSDDKKRIAAIAAAVAMVTPAGRG
ncbi:MAG: acetyl-CoA carboxylase biotin carboxylase subunit [Acidobacteria bacterium]|nr:acetyl-CoA carboxylase biotin carboxylase subunit [Acidobacteriota bacterium]